MAPLLTATLAVAAGCASASKSEPEQVRIDLVQSEVLGPGQLNQAQLQGLTMNMADLFAGAIGQLAGQLEMSAQTPWERRTVHSLKYFAALAAFDCVLDPSPAAGFLDMLVLARLHTISIERRIAMVEAGEAVPLTPHAEDVLATSRRVEEVVWAEADKVLTDKQQQELVDLVDAYLADKPGLVNIYVVRLNDFTAMRDAPRSEVAKGLLAEVSDATRAVDDARLLGERALWYSRRAPLLLGYQVEHTLYSIADQPEIKQALANYDEMTGAIRDIADQTEIYPAFIDEQRAAFFEDLAAQRHALLEEIDAREGRLSAVLEELRVTLEAANVAITSANETVESVDGVVSRFDRAEHPEREPLDIAKVRDAAVEAGMAADEFTELLESVQGLLASPDWEARSTQIGQAWGAVEQGGRGWISLTFRQGLYLIGAGFLALLAYKWITVRLIAPPERSRSDPSG